MVVFGAGAVALALLVVVGFLATSPPSRTLTLDELKGHVAFELHGVQFQETYFKDLSAIDGGTTVSFNVRFPDGASENLTLVFQTFLCYDASVSSTHRNPQVVLHAECGQGSILVAVI
jgi:hypothetical protein